MSPEDQLPPEAFSLYLELRSVHAVSERLGIPESLIYQAKRRERWAERATEVDRAAAEALMRRRQEAVRAMHEEHATTGRYLLALGVEALKKLQEKQDLPRYSAALKAIEVGAKMRSLALGEPTERQAVDVEDIKRREREEWLAEVDSPRLPEPEDGNGSGPAPPRF